jgi:hypothetical protein
MIVVFDVSSTAHRLSVIDKKVYAVERQVKHLRILPTVLVLWCPTTRPTTESLQPHFPRRLSSALSSTEANEP